MFVFILHGSRQAFTVSLQSLNLPFQLLNALRVGLKLVLRNAQLLAGSYSASQPRQLPRAAASKRT